MSSFLCVLSTFDYEPVTKLQRQSFAKFPIVSYEWEKMGWFCGSFLRVVCERINVLSLIVALSVESVGNIIPIENERYSRYSVTQSRNRFGPIDFWSPTAQTPGIKFIAILLCLYCRWTIRMEFPARMIIHIFFCVRCVHSRSTECTKMASQGMEPRWEIVLLVEQNER